MCCSGSRLRCVQKRRRDVAVSCRIKQAVVGCAWNVDRANRIHDHNQLEDGLQNNIAIQYTRREKLVWKLHVNEPLLCKSVSAVPH